MPDSYRLRDWFSDTELDTCPACAQRSVLAAPDTAVLLCLECGVVALRGEREHPRSS